MQKQKKKLGRKFVLRCKTAGGILEIFSEDRDSLFAYAISKIRKCQKVMLKQLPEGHLLFHASHGRVKIF